MILFHFGFCADELPRLWTLAPLAEQFRLGICPTASPGTAMHITAIFAPPSTAGRLTTGLLLKISADARDPVTGDSLPHIIGGDFEATSCGQPFGEWLQ